jgi:pimeloyl-ACP methyl ester carboxylesterase
MDLESQFQNTFTPGVLLFHERNDQTEYNWFSYIPESLSKTEKSYILITGFNANINDDYNEMTEISRNEAEYRIQFAEKYRYILLTPVIPRPASDDTYVIAFDYRVFLNSTGPFLQRPDEKLNLMIDQLVAGLQEDGYNVDSKVLVEGFSAGGMFAQKYAMLHPERIKAIAAGQVGGWVTLPISTYEKNVLDWPLGIHDFESLTGFEFNQTLYLQIPQYIYIGDDDIYNSHVYPGSSWQSDSQIAFLNEYFGTIDPIRLENQFALLNNIGYKNIAFQKFSGIGHDHLNQAFLDAVFSFFDSIRSPYRVYIPLSMK